MFGNQFLPCGCCVGHERKGAEPWLGWLSPAYHREVRVRFQGSPRGVCDGQSITGTEVQYFGFPPSTFHQCCIFLIQHRCCVFLVMNIVFT
jgi:hypothetical protein